MKINLELTVAAIFLLVNVFLSLYLIPHISDNYQQYEVGREILRNPDFLWKEIDTIRIERLTGNDPIFNYPPLHIFGYALFILLGLSPTIWAAINIIILVYLMYKIESKAIPFLMLSFLFLHHMIFGFNDFFLINLFLAAFYFFERKPYLSGVFMGLTALIKPIGFLVIGFFFLSFLLFKRKEYKTYLKVFLIALLVLSPWYLRNAYLLGLDPTGIILGTSISGLIRTENFLNVGFQAIQPEREIFDTSPFYPTPLDPLFYIGIAFLIYNIVRARRNKEFKLNTEHIFIICTVALYFFLHVIHFSSFMTLRYYMFIFPLLAIQIVRGIPEKHLPKVYAACLIIFMVWIFLIPRYSYPPSYVSLLNENCLKVRGVVGNDPIYLKAFDRNFIMYTCNLNITSQENGWWILDYDNGSLTKVNKTT